MRLVVLRVWLVDVAVDLVDEVGLVIGELVDNFVLACGVVVVVEVELKTVIPLFSKKTPTKLMNSTNITKHDRMSGSRVKSMVRQRRVD